MNRHNLLTLFALVCVSFVSLAAFGEEIQGKDAMGRDYWLYVPDEIDPNKTYTLVVGVHGAGGNGKGAAGYAGWVKQHDVIVLGASYRYEGGYYQYLQNKTDQQTIDLFKVLRKEYQLHDKLFIAGFSGGSQYAHRFAMKYPEIVVGCAAHSGGTWGTGDYPSSEKQKPYINPKARGVLFVISCGEKDTKKSFGEAPFGRLEWAKRYEQMLEKGGFIYDAQYWPNVGHNQSKGARQQTVDCFVASTQRLPEYEAERDEIAKLMRAKDYLGAWSIIKARMAHEDAGNEGILGKVHAMFFESLEKEVIRIDRMAERLVRKIIHEHKDAPGRRAALEQHRSDFAGAPKTMKAVDKALADLE